MSPVLPFALSRYVTFSVSLPPNHSSESFAWVPSVSMSEDMFVGRAGIYASTVPIDHRQMESANSHCTTFVELAKPPPEAKPDGMRIGPAPVWVKLQGDN